MSLLHLSMFITQKRRNNSKTDFLNQLKRIVKVSCACLKSTFHFVEFCGKQRPSSLSSRGTLNSAQPAFKSLSHKNPEQPEALVAPLLLGFLQNKGSVFLERGAGNSGKRWKMRMRARRGNVTLRDVIRRGCDM